MRNTIRKVMIVVPVLMTSCQVSLKPNSGPVTPQTTTRRMATRNVPALPDSRAVALANLLNQPLLASPPAPRVRTGRPARIVRRLLCRPRHCKLSQAEAGLQPPTHGNVPAQGTISQPVTMRVAVWPGAAFPGNATIGTHALCTAINRFATHVGDRLMVGALSHASRCAL